VPQTTTTVSVNFNRGARDAALAPKHRPVDIEQRLKRLAARRTGELTEK
jgi:hypothetical protein